MSSGASSDAARASRTDHGEFQTRADWPLLLLRFNCDIASYAHASWLPAGLPAYEELACGQYREALSIGLLAELGLQDCFDWVMRSPTSRLFMVDDEARCQLALIVGICAYRNQLRQIVQRQQLEALRQALGDAQDALWLPLAEQVPHAVAGVNLLPLASQPVVLRQHLMQEGLQQMLRLLDPKDPKQRASAKRARLCLHKDEVARIRPCLPTIEAMAMSRAMIEHAVSRWTPQWNWLF
jgi:YOP proteins translocation protein K (YscK)